MAVVVALAAPTLAIAQSGGGADVPTPAMASTDQAFAESEVPQQWIERTRADLSDAQQYDAFRATMQKQFEAETFSPLVADAYLTLLNRDRLEADRDFAQQVYLRLTESLGSATSEAEREVHRRHAAQLMPLLSDADVEQVLRSDRDARVDKWTFQEGAGEYLERWWRRGDPMPGTLHNERLIEHIERVAVATEQYGCQDRLSGFDDRGKVFVRYGDPSRTSEITYNNMDFQLEVFRFGVSVTQRDFPDNELWSYPEIDDTSYFIFTESGRRCYELGGASDLVPSRLYQARGRSERAENIAYSGMVALRHVYAELALFHIDFSSAYSEIESYVAFQENAASRARIEDVFGVESGSGGTQTRSVGAGFNQTRTVASSANFGIPSPAGFVTSMARKIEQQDRSAAYRRRQNTPRQVTDLITSEEVMPVVVQTTRFLNLDGTTRVEIVWGLQNQHLLPLDSEAETRPSFLMIDAVQFDTEYRRVDQVEKKYTIQPSSLVKQDLFVSPPIVFDDVRHLAHIGMQWRQFDIEGTLSEDATVGERMRVATVRSDSLRPLHASGERLEMSDVQSMVSPSGVIDDAVAFPFASLNPDMPLVLHFEVYHLAYGENDQTRYTVAYDVERRAPKGWRRLFGSADIEKTTTEMTYSGTERRTEEFISIDLSTLRQPKTQELRVTVRVTDTITGETVARVKRIQLVGTDEL